MRDPFRLVRCSLRRSQGTTTCWNYFFWRPSMHQEMLLLLPNTEASKEFRYTSLFAHMHIHCCGARSPATALQLFASATKRVHLPPQFLHECNEAAGQQRNHILLRHISAYTCVSDWCLENVHGTGQKGGGEYPIQIRIFVTAHCSIGICQWQRTMSPQGTVIGSWIVFVAPNSSPPIVSPGCHQNSRAASVIQRRMLTRIKGVLSDETE